MKPQKFRELTDKLADVITEIRTQAQGNPVEVLAVLDSVLRHVTWSARPETGEALTDAKGNAGTLGLRLSMEVRR